MRLVSSLLPALFITIFGWIAYPASAQETAENAVRGEVVDGDAGSSLEGATVALHNAADSSLVTGALSMRDGTFEIADLDYGRYYLRVSYVGYRTVFVDDVTITANESVVDVGTVELITDTAQMAEVEVASEREFMEVGIDRTIYNTLEQPITAGGSGRDVLETIPSVEVDIDGNISLRGSQGVSVYLNGKPAPMTGDALTSFLAGLSAENIERVEVIPNPSARYDPEGTSGILNIVLAKNVDIGWGGSVNGTASSRGEAGGSISTHLGRGPWRAHANYSGRYSEWDNDGWRYRENKFLDPLTILEQDMEGSRGGLSHNVHTSVDYSFNERNSLSAAAIVSRRSRDSEQLNSYDELDADHELTNRYSRSTDGTETDFNIDYRLSFQRVMTPREHELSIEARFEDEREDEFEHYVERLIPLTEPDASGSIDDLQDVVENAREREASLEFDYVRALGEHFNAELGYDGEQEWVDETFYSESLDSLGNFLPDADLNNTFTYTQRQHSAYGILGSRLGKFGAQFGLRLEQAFTTFDLRTTGQTFDNRYLSVFPSVHLSYELTRTNTFRLSYSKRVRRPNEWQLNPFGDYDDPTSIRQGNPFLTPEYTHSAEVSYSRLGESYTISLSPYVRYTVDEISWHERITDDGVTILTFENFDTEQSYGAEVIGSLTLGGWLKGNASINAYKRVTEAGNLSSELSNDAIGYRTRASFTADVRRDLQVQVWQSYRSPMKIPGGRIAAEHRTNIAVQQRILSGRASINLRARDLFGEPNDLIRRDLDRYYQEYFRQSNSRSVQLSFRYNFGQGGNDDGGDRRGRRGRY